MLPPPRTHLKRHRHQRDGHRIVGVDDIGMDVAQHAHELPAGVHVEFASWREADEAQAFGGAPLQLAMFVRDEHRGIAGRLEAGDGQEHLVLAAAPGARGIDVKGPNHARAAVTPCGAAAPTASRT